MAEAEIPEGYPDSPAEELTPTAPMLPLDFADREAEAEGEVEPGGAPPPEDGVSEDRLVDSPDADQLAFIELGGGGSRRGDRPNFEDNAAEWSRSRP